MPGDKSTKRKKETTATLPMGRLDSNANPMLKRYLEATSIAVPPAAPPLKRHDVGPKIPDLNLVAIGKHSLLRRRGIFHNRKQSNEIVFKSPDRKFDHFKNKFRHGAQEGINVDLEASPLSVCSHASTSVSNDQQRRKYQHRDRPMEKEIPRHQNLDYKLRLKDRLLKETEEPSSFQSPSFPFEPYGNHAAPGTTLSCLSDGMTVEEPVAPDFFESRRQEVAFPADPPMEQIAERLCSVLPKWHAENGQTYTQRLAGRIFRRLIASHPQMFEEQVRNEQVPQQQQQRAENVVPETPMSRRTSSASSGISNLIIRRPDEFKLNIKPSPVLELRPSHRFDAQEERFSAATVEPTIANIEAFSSASLPPPIDERFEFENEILQASFHSDENYFFNFCEHKPDQQAEDHQEDLFNIASTSTNLALNSILHSFEEKTESVNYSNRNNAKLGALRVVQNEIYRRRHHQQQRIGNYEQSNNQRALLIRDVMNQEEQQYYRVVENNNNEALLLANDRSNLGMMENRRNFQNGKQEVQSPGFKFTRRKMF